MDVNSVARETLAAIMGTLAGLYALPGGPAMALSADMTASEAFINAYGKVTAASQALLPWTEIFDGIDDIIAWHKFPSERKQHPLFDPTTFDPNTLLRISATVNTAFTSALNCVPPRRDPLVLDLDGGGITTSGINPSAPILFDQNGDGTKTATGWIAAGEAIVVRDLNGNGTIDSTRELFGDGTILTHGTNAGKPAANDFQALADLDLDASGVADGKFDANDVAFASVKLWKDDNQNGISEAGEHHTFAELGVASINVSGAVSNVNLSCGDTQTFSGSFTISKGAVGDAGTAELADPKRRCMKGSRPSFRRRFEHSNAQSSHIRFARQRMKSESLRERYEAYGPQMHGQLQEANNFEFKNSCRAGLLWAMTRPVCLVDRKQLEL